MALLVLLGASVFCPVGANRAQAQDIAAEHSIHLDPAQFNMEGLSPGPKKDWLFGGFESRVFWSAKVSGPLVITIRQYTDGLMTVITPVRIEARTITNGSSTGDGSTATSTVSGKIIGGGFEASAMQSAAFTRSRTESSSSQSDVINSLTFRTEGNLLIAVVTYTVDTVKTIEEISLGMIDLATGKFTAFADGFLEGKRIVTDCEGELKGVRIGPNAPAKTNPMIPKTFKHGWIDSTGQSQGADVWVLTGYWVEVGRINGKIVSIVFDPVYEHRAGASFLVRASNPYMIPGGKRVQY